MPLLGTFVTDENGVKRYISYMDYEFDLYVNNEYVGPIMGHVHLDEDGWHEKFLEQYDKWRFAYVGDVLQIRVEELQLRTVQCDYSFKAI